MRLRMAPLALGASLLLSVVAGPAWADGAPVDSASDEQKQGATEAFIAAKEHFDAGRFEEALAGFRASFEIVASPNSTLMAARSLAGLGRNVEAYREVVKAKSQADAISATNEKYAATSEAAQTEMDDLKTKIGFVTVDVADPEPGAMLSVGGENVDSLDWGSPIPVEPGMVTVTMTGRDAQTVDVAAGGSASVYLEPPSAPPPPPPEPEGEGFNPLDGGDDQRITAYVFGGIGVVGVVMFAIFGAQHNSKLGELEDNCPNNQCSADLQSTADDGKTAGTIANIGLIVGAVGLTAGTALFVTTLFGDDEGENVAVGFSPSSVRLQGSF